MALDFDLDDLLEETTKQVGSINTRGKYSKELEQLTPMLLKYAEDNKNATPAAIAKIASVGLYKLGAIKKDEISTLVDVKMKNKKGEPTTVQMKKYPIAASRIETILNRAKKNA